MTTLLQLADRCQLALNDSGVGTWPQATVEAWVLDAIRDYSQYFPRVRTSTTTITTPSSTPHVFDLPGDFLAVVLVEFPDGEDPPEYLQLRSRTRDGFWDYTGFYDIEPSHDAATAGKLYLSENVRAGAIPCAARIRCLDAQTGSVRWSHPGGGITGPVVAGGKVYTASTADRFFR